MHYNHVKTLRMVKELGDYLVVNVVSDERMKVKKGKHRPLLPLNERMNILRELRCVDEVISIPGTDYPLFAAIREARPDIVCINDDENPNLEKEQEFCYQQGVNLVRIHRIDDSVSTTKLIERLKQL